VLSEAKIIASNNRTSIQLHYAEFANTSNNPSISLDAFIALTSCGGSCAPLGVLICSIQDLRTIWKSAFLNNLVTLEVSVTKALVTLVN